MSNDLELPHRLHRLGVGIPVDSRAYARDAITLERGVSVLATDIVREGVVDVIIVRESFLLAWRRQQQQGHEARPVCSASSLHP